MAAIGFTFNSSRKLGYDSFGLIMFSKSSSGGIEYDTSFDPFGIGSGGANCIYVLVEPVLKRAIKHEYDIELIDMDEKDVAKIERLVMAELGYIRATGQE